MAKDTHMAAHIVLLGSTSAQHKSGTPYINPVVATEGSCRGVAHENIYKGKLAQTQSVPSMQGSIMGGIGNHLCAILVGNAAALLLQQGVDHAAEVIGGSGKEHAL